MAAGDSGTSICNTALALLSEDPIADIDPPDGSKRGRLCRQFYDPCRRAMLGSLPWQCATKQASLPERSVPPDFAYAHGYTLPVDFLTAYEIEPDDMAWEVMFLGEGGACLASDAPPPLKLTYIADVQDPRLYPPLLVTALAADLAASMAYPLARDSALKQACMADRDAALKQAALVNGTQASYRNLVADATTPGGIGRMALALLGGDQGVDPPENNRRARLARQFYDPCRRSILNALPWHFATRQASLPERAAPPGFGYAHCYVLPSDFLSLYEVAADDMPWEVMHLDDAGVCLASDAPAPVELTYVADVEDPVLFPPLMVTALIADIAANLAHSLVKDPGVRQACIADRDAALKQAAMVNATQASFRNLQIDATTAGGVGRMALAMLGGDQDVDPPENNRRARLARQFFPIARRSILQAGNWRCARKNAQLTAIPDLVLPQWGTAYKLPPDFVRFYDIGRDAPWLRWEVIAVEGQGLCLLADGAHGGQALWVTYIYDLADPALMDPLMVQAIAAEIAVALALPLLKDGKTRQQMEAARDRYLSDARTSSAQQASPVVFDADVLLRARW